MATDITTNRPRNYGDLPHRLLGLVDFIELTHGVLIPLSRLDE